MILSDFYIFIAKMDKISAFLFFEENKSNQEKAIK